MRHHFSVVLVLLSIFTGGITPVPAADREISLPINGKLLKETRLSYMRGDKETVKRVEDMIAYAKRFLYAKPVIVTNKKRIAPSNDPRDYVTLSPYWWPDSTKAGGLPYVRHDGKRNPEVYEYANREQGNDMGKRVEIMSVLYYITGDKLYAKACTEQLRAWFTDAETGINPNMSYSQIVPGHTNMRGTGIIDSRRFVKAILMSQLIEGSKVWTETDRKQLKAWAETYCYWLEHSTQGRKESKAINNHGLWYDAIHIMLLAYLDRKTDIGQAVSSTMAKLGEQIADNGSLPQELQRTLSLHYSTFAMEALVTVAHVVEPFGINLWKETTTKGTGMQDIVNFLIPYYLEPETWPHKQIRPFDKWRGAVMVYEAAMNTGKKDYLRTARKIETGKKKDDIDAVIYGMLNSKN